MVKILLCAGLGGIMPTLCRLAASYGDGTGPTSLSLQLIYGLALFFVIGGAVALVLGESDFKKAFMLGISAPAFIASTYSAATQGRNVPVATAPMPASPSGRLYDPAGNLERLFGIGEAIAAEPASTLAPVVLAPSRWSGHLTVQSNISSATRGYAIDPVELRFEGEGGSLLSSVVLDPKVTSTVSIPAGARSIIASIDGQQRRVELPPGALSSATLKLTIDTSHFADLQWALGSNRPVRVEGLSVMLADLAR